MKYLFALAISVCSFMAMAQIDNKRYINKVKEMCPKADITEIEIKSDYVEIEYLCGDQLIEIGLGINADWLFTETKTVIPPSVLEKINKKLEKKYADWTVDEYVLVEMKDTSFYKVELMQEGVEENTYFALDGKYYHIRNMVMDENWTITYLSQAANYKDAPFNFLQPDKIYDMPDLLKEISGIAFADENTIYCVQDEMGIVFKYDISKEDISGMFRFTDIGDFEDLAIRKEKVYVLRSDGTLFWFNHQNFDGKINQIVVPVNCLNMEGLDFNPVNNQFYLACKDQLIDSQDKNRTIFSIHADKMTNPQVAIVVSSAKINEMLAKKYPEIDNSRMQINPSAFAIHPQTGEKYVLSASSRLIAIFDKEQLTNIYPLPAEIYYKPEGLTFSPDGDLFISSEGIKNGYVDGQIFFFSKK